MLPVRSVAEGLQAFAAEHAVTYAAQVEAWKQSHLHELPDRYGRLAMVVALALPDGWDSHAVWTMKVGVIKDAFDTIYAGSQLVNGPGSDDEGDGFIQVWEITLCLGHLDRFSDAAVRGVIVHELAHVASALPSDPQRRNTELCENRADNIAKWWGFVDDLSAVGVVK